MTRDRQALLDIANAVRQVLRYVQDIDRSQLEADDEKQAAILYRLVVIGEATKRLSPEFRARYLDIPWRQIAGLRDIVVHSYDELDLDILWNVITINLVDLLAAVEAILGTD